MDERLKWLNGYATMYAEPNPNGKRVRDLTEKSLVNARDEVVLWQGVPFVEVEYMDTKAWRGWVYAGMLEDYVEMLPKDLVTLGEQTPAAHDAEQFVIYNGTKQVNLCGQICAAYCAGVTLPELMTQWQAEKPSVWRRLFPRRGVAADGTGPADVIGMLEAVGLKGYPLVDATRDPYLGRSRYTPAWLKRLTEKGGQVIASVRINKAGRLESSGDLHWVVVTTVEPERCGYGFVTLYNPFSNRAEMYSWSEFVASARLPFGVYIPKETL